MRFVQLEKGSVSYGWGVTGTLRAREDLTGRAFSDPAILSKVSPKHLLTACDKLVGFQAEHPRDRKWKLPVFVAGAPKPTQHHVRLYFSRRSGQRARQVQGEEELASLRGGVWRDSRPSRIPHNAVWTALFSYLRFRKKNGCPRKKTQRSHKNPFFFP